MEQYLAHSLAGSRKEALARVESELSVIFGGAGKQALIREVSQGYGVSLSDALERPEVFRSALLHLVGDLGSSMVMGRINKRVWGSLEHPASRARIRV